MGVATNKLSPRQNRFVKNLSKGIGKAESANLAGYSPGSSSSIASQLLKKTKIVGALNKAGLTDSAIADGIKTSIDSGLGVKSTNSDAIRGLQLASTLKGHGQTQQQPTTQTNILIKEYNAMSDKDIATKLESIQKDIKALQ